MTEVKDIPIERVAGAMCAWSGCAAFFRGNELPKGWIGFFAYESLHASARRDGVLCPQHAATLETLLKPLARSTSSGPRDERRP